MAEENGARAPDAKRDAIESLPEAEDNVRAFTLPTQRMKNRCLECCVVADTLNVWDCPRCGKQVRTCESCRGGLCPCQSQFPSRHVSYDGAWWWSSSITCSGTHVLERLERCERCAMWYCSMHTRLITEPCRVCKEPFRWCCRDCPDVRTFAQLVCHMCVNTKEGKAFETVAQAIYLLDDPNGVMRMQFYTPNAEVNARNT